jgi:hypothetical protein
MIPGSDNPEIRIGIDSIWARNVQDRPDVVPKASALVKHLAGGRVSQLGWYLVPMERPLKANMTARRPWNWVSSHIPSS